MLARINVFIAVGVLVLTALFVAGRYLVVLPVSWFAPSLAPYVAGAVVLAVLMLTVDKLSVFQSRFEALAIAAAGRRPGPLGVAAHAAIGVSHLLLGYAGWQLLQHGPGASLPPFVLGAWLYAGGVVAALTDWRRRALDPAR